MIDQANLIVLFQPIYQFAVRDVIKKFPADRGRDGRWSCSRRAT